MSGDAGVEAAEAPAPTVATNKENAPPVKELQAVGVRDVLFGVRVRKSFGVRFFWGSIAGRYDVAGSAFYKISFDDGDVDVFAANEVLEDVKLARRHAKEDKLRPSEAADEAQTEYQAEMRRPTLKRKRDTPGDGDIRVRLWGQRLFASIYTSDERQTFLKDFLRTEDGGIGELEATGLVNIGDRIVAVNGKPTVGLASWEISDVIRKARRPLLLLFARGDGAVPVHNASIAPAQGPSAQQGSGVVSQVVAAAPQSAPPVQEPSRLENARTSGSDQSRPSYQIPRPTAAPPAPLTAPRAHLGHTVLVNRPPVEAHAAGAPTIRPQYVNQQPLVPAQPPAPSQVGQAAAARAHLAAVNATNQKMIQLREVLLQRQKEHLERHERMQQQLDRMGPNLPTNGLMAASQRAPVTSMRPVDPASSGQGQWTSHQHQQSTALMPAAPNNYGAPQRMGVAMAMSQPGVNPSWQQQQQREQVWGYSPVQNPYSTVPSIRVPAPMRSVPLHAPSSRFEVVDSSADANRAPHNSTPSQASEPSLHAPCGVQRSATTPQSSPAKEVAGLSPGNLQDLEMDMDDDAAAIAALADESPSKEPSKASSEPTSFLSLTSASTDTSSSTSKDAPLAEGNSYFVVTIHKPRLYVTLGSLGSHVSVTSFVRDDRGGRGEIEESGKVYVGDVIVGVNGSRLGPSMSPSMLAHLVNTTPRPMDIWFERASWDTLVGST